MTTICAVFAEVDDDARSACGYFIMIGEKGARMIHVVAYGNSVRRQRAAFISRLSLIVASRPI